MVEEQTKKCPFCAETIKAEAIVCRFCNRDIASPEVTKRMVIERTDKKFKKHVVIAVVLAIIGFMFFMSGLAGIGNKNVDSGFAKIGFGILFFIIGLIWGTINRIRMWWDRG